MQRKETKGVIGSAASLCVFAASNFAELPRWLRGVKDEPTVPGNSRRTKHRVGRFGPRSTRGFGGVRLPTLRAARNEKGAARADSLPLHRWVCTGFTG